MALQKSHNKFGTDFTSAYHRVEQMRVSKSGINFTVQIYHQQNGDILDSEGYAMPYNPAGTEPLTQAYNYLKTLPEYQGAIDV